MTPHALYLLSIADIGALYLLDGYGDVLGKFMQRTKCIALRLCLFLLYSGTFMAGLCYLAWFGLHWIELVFITP